MQILLPSLGELRVIECPKVEMFPDGASRSVDCCEKGIRDRCIVQQPKPLNQWVHSLKTDLLDQMGKFDSLIECAFSLWRKVDSLEANIKDLEAEASFFNATASQVAVRVHFFVSFFTLMII
ncbi:hypothetical protein DEO72_LG8g1901 [Vigna unguiculata]|uniref:Rx N-terminal domain-containing protein n=1 Tax=Vigna unguiculata TaxID=3917 RepID=A0A4D6MTC1_VIGUN|nr:hypothetical protein DEO72_LG8g1901 [Vigna unguiculata]